MGRVSTVDDARVFDAVGQHLAGHGSIRLQDVVTATGVSVGSLYHRYGSREALLARTWIDAVQAFQEQFLQALDSAADDAGEQAAMATSRFCRSAPARARVLVCCRRAELLSQDLPRELADQIDVINDRARERVLQFADTRGYRVDACQLGLVAFPLGAVRMYLPNAKVPEALDGYVAAAFRAVVSQAG